MEPESFEPFNTIHYIQRKREEDLRAEYDRMSVSGILFMIVARPPPSHVVGRLEHSDGHETNFQHSEGTILWHDSKLTMPKTFLQ